MREYGALFCVFSHVNGNGHTLQYHHEKEIPVGRKGEMEMTAKQRVLTSRLIERANRNQEPAKGIGLKHRLKPLSSWEPVKNPKLKNTRV